MEMRSIHLERAENDREQAAARAEQIERFGKIADGINVAIRNSQQQFAETMGQLNTTLQTAKRAQRNTEPYATLGYRTVELATPTASGTQMEFNILFTNTGTEVAKNTSWDAQFYPGKLDDTKTQKEISDAFDKWWDSSKHPGAFAVEPGEPRLFSVDTPPFTIAQRKEFSADTLTLYLLIRFKWSDHTGNWVGDFCAAYQDLTHGLTILHPCVEHNNHRYRDSHPKQD